ncbi:condensin, putative [Ixodes scapularis]|uniref:Condensin, putative n=1 Tax=Ixodes scapularis TaxID=6945 RepID=B7PUC1_IXOSC|nr:condensin, putative [Ixodes scapularis]|eukprot:XP_002405902.1 condensin, putative [Ixodes scapularis]
MGDLDNLVSNTLSVFADLPFDLLDADWISAAWDNKYTDVAPADVNLLDSCEGNAYALLDELSSACDVCQMWYRFSGLDETEDANTDEKLWKTLMDNGVHYKALLGLLYTGISHGSSSTASVVHKKIALRFAKLYFNLVLVPGSNAYRIFQESLFERAIQTLRLPSKNSVGSLDGGGSRNASQMTGSRGSKHAAKKKAVSQQENLDMDGSDGASVVHEVLSEEALLEFLGFVTDALKDLVCMLQQFSLRQYGEATESMIQQLCELTQFDIPGASVSFSIDRVQDYRNWNYRYLTTFAYCALKLLCLPQHGDPGDNFRFAAKNLMPHILMLSAGNAQTVGKPFTSIRDNAVSFVTHVASKCDASLRENFQETLLVLIHNLAFSAVDRTDFRLKTGQAVLTVMGELEDEMFLRAVHWFTKLATSPMSSRRVFALEMILLLIWDQRVVDKRSELLLTAMKRCNDKVATVKAKALSVLASVTSERAESWVPLLKVSGEVDPEEEGAEGQQVAVEDDRLSQLMEVLKYRVEDPKVNVRKAALSLLQNVLCASADFAKEEYLEILTESCLDPTVLVRKQALQSLTRCVQAHPEKESVQRLWLSGALPLVLDPESTVLEKAVETVEELVVGPLCQRGDSQLAWSLLGQVGQARFKDHHKYLQQAVLQLHRLGKIRVSELHSLKQHVGGPHNASVWLLLSKLTLCCDLGEAGFVLNYWEQQQLRLLDGHGDPPGMPAASTDTMKHMFQVLQKVAHHLPTMSLRKLIGDLEQRLSQLSLPVAVMSRAVDCLHSVSLTVHKERPELGERAVQNWCKQMIETHHLVLTCLTAPLQGSPEEAATNARGHRRSKGKTMEDEFRTTPRLRATAVVVLGMLSLQNEGLAKKVVPAIGQALSTSSDPLVRANAVVALTDLCKRYAVLVDPYLPAVTRCLKDPQESVRHLVLVCLLRLLQQDFVKLQGRVFYRLLACLADESPAVRELAEFGLVDRVCKRFPHVFYQRFVECLCYFNQYRGVTGQAASSAQESVIESREQDQHLFSLEGPRHRERRMGIYRFLLQNMADEDRFKLNLAITQNVLGPCVEEGQEGVDTLCPEMLQDALQVLCCEEIKLQSIVGAEEAAADEEPAQALLITTRKTLLSNLVKVSLVENVVPVVLALKHKLEAARSPLLRALLLFLRELMRDYKNEVKDILAHDRKTASEVAFDLKHLEQEEEEETQRARVGGATPRTPACTANPALRAVLDSARKLREEASKRQSIVAVPGRAPDDVDGAAAPAERLGEEAEQPPEGPAARVVSPSETPKGRKKKANAASPTGKQRSSEGPAARGTTSSARRGASAGQTSSTKKRRKRAEKQPEEELEQAETSPDGSERLQSVEEGTCGSPAGSESHEPPVSPSESSADEAPKKKRKNKKKKNEAKRVPQETIAAEPVASTDSGGRPESVGTVPSAASESICTPPRSRGSRSVTPGGVRSSCRLPSPRRKFPIEMDFVATPLAPRTASPSGSPPKDGAAAATARETFKRPAAVGRHAAQQKVSTSTPLGEPGKKICVSPDVSMIE